MRRSRSGEVEPARWTGAELEERASEVAAGDEALARQVAFAVARATRDGDNSALRALARLLPGIQNTAESDQATLINTISALQYALILPYAASADWAPPRDAVARIVELGLASRGAVGEQAEGFLWALVNRRLAADWLDPDAVSAIGEGVTSDELYEELLRQVRANRILISFVDRGKEFPSVPA